MITTKAKTKAGTRAKPAARRLRSKPVVSEEIRALQNNRRLSPEELGELTRRLAEAKTKAVAAKLKDAIMRGFYGTL